MTKDIKHLIGYVVGLAVCISLMFLFIDYYLKLNNKSHFTFPTTIVVSNQTEYKEFDELVPVILNKVLGYDTMSIVIYNMVKPIGTEDYQVQGFIIKDESKKHSYILFTSATELTISVETFLAHELAHLRQMELGNLKLLGSKGQVYLGDTILYSNVPYQFRHSELDAFQDERMIENKLEELLYK